MESIREPGIASKLLVPLPNPIIGLLRRTLSLLYSRQT